MASIPGKAANLPKSDSNRAKLIQIAKAYGRLNQPKNDVKAWVNPQVQKYNPATKQMETKDQIPKGAFGAPTVDGVATSFKNIHERSGDNMTLFDVYLGGNLIHEMIRLNSPGLGGANKETRRALEREAYAVEAGWYAANHVDAPSGIWTANGAYNTDAINAMANRSVNGAAP